MITLIHKEIIAMAGHYACGAFICHFNPFMPIGLFCLSALDRLVLFKGCLVSVCSSHVLIEILAFNVNNVDPDGPQFAASDLGLDCLPMSLLWDARHKWVNKADNFCSFLFAVLHIKPL